MWLLHERDALHDMDATIRRFAPGVAEVGAGLERWLVEHILEEDMDYRDYVVKT